MSDLTPQVAAALALAIELGQRRTLTCVVEATLPVLADAFRAQLVLFGVAGTRHAGAAVYPKSEALVRALAAEASPIWEDGPLTRWCRAHPSWTPVRLDDVLTPEEWESIPFYRQTARQIGASCLMYVPVLEPGPTALAGYFVARPDRNFTDAEKRDASTLQPVLVASHGPYLHQLDQDDVLTPRERQVLELTADGLTAQAIASRLHISNHTVRKHLQHAYRRLGTNDRAAAVSELRVRGAAHTHPTSWQDAAFST